MKSVLLSLAAAWNVPLPAAQTPSQSVPVYTVAQPGSSVGFQPQYQAVNGPQVVYAIPEPAAPAIEAEDMYWGDQDYPPSRVLGIGRNVGSNFYGITSGLAFGIGCWCIAQSNLLNILSGSTVNGWYVAGSLLVPYSWGLHVACWIQRQNEA